MKNSAPPPGSLSVAKVGRTVGFQGFCKLHLTTDFPEQFFSGSVFDTPKGPLTVETFDLERLEVKFQGYDSQEAAKPLVNRLLFTSEEKTREAIRLEEGEHFWFDIIGCTVVENGELLGTVADIERYPTDDMLLVKTDKALTAGGLAKEFFLPYNDRHIVDADILGKTLTVRLAKELLEAS